MHYTEQQDSDTWGKLNKLKCELNYILNRKTEFALFWTRQKYFEQGEQAGKVLAHRVKQIQSQNIIPSTFDKENNLIQIKEILTPFREFYQELYTSQGGMDKIFFLQLKFQL